MNFAFVDPRIVPTLLKIGKLDGIVPIFSCSGHTADEQVEKAKRKGIVPSNRINVFQRRYIMFVVNEKGIGIIDLMDEWIDSLSVEIWRIIKPKIVKLWRNDKTHGKVHCFCIEFNYTINQGHSPEQLEVLWGEMIDYVCEHHHSGG